MNFFYKRNFDRRS